MATVGDFVALAKKQAGKPYVYAATGPNEFDCSGLVVWCLEQLGINDCPRTSEEQWSSYVNKVPQSQVGPGTLIFTNWPGEVSPGHVQIAIDAKTYVGADNSAVGVVIGDWTAESAHFVGFGNIPKLTGGGPSSGSGSSSTSGGGGILGGAFAALLAGGALGVGGVAVAAAVLIPAAIVAMGLLTGIIVYLVEG